LVWAYHHGDPGDLLVRHLCHNRKCCNIEHLAIGTQAQNYQDNLASGGSSSLTEDDIREMRRLYETGELTTAGIARRYGRYYSTVRSIVRGLTYSGVR
jgi:hypothetical protein